MKKDVNTVKNSGKKQEIMKIFGKHVPLWVVMLLLVALIFVSIIHAITVNQRTYATLFGEVIDVTTQLTITELIMGIAKQSQSAVGDTAATAVTMAIANPEARTMITKPDWLYQVEIECITGTTPASTTFKVDLYIGNTLNATLYVQSDAAPATGEKVTCKFDIGADLSASESYMIVVTAV